MITRVLSTSAALNISRAKVRFMRILPSCSEGVEPHPELPTRTTDQHRSGEVSPTSSRVGFFSNENVAMPVYERAGNCTGVAPMC